MGDILTRLAPMICDAHVHIGKWNDGIYFSPQDVANKLKDLGVKKWAVSSTSSIDNNFDAVKAEFDEMLALAQEETVPLLWVTPEMIEQSGDLTRYDSILFKGLKIHAFANQWNLNGQAIRLVMAAAEKRKLPVLIHTAWTPESEAGKYNKICSEFSGVKIILAHGRPLDQTIQVMRGNENVYVDTAYMPVKDIAEVLHTLGTDRILFGTDFPLDEYYYPGESLTERYRNRVTMLAEMFGEDVFLTWANKNYYEVFDCIT